MNLQASTLPRLLQDHALGLSTAPGGSGPDIRPVAGPAVIPEQRQEAGPWRAEGAGTEPRDSGRAHPAKAERRAAPPPYTGSRPVALFDPSATQLFDQSRAQDSLPVAFGSRLAELGSEAYRRAGAAPPFYSEAPSLFRFSV